MFTSDRLGTRSRSYLVHFERAVKLRIILLTDVTNLKELRHDILSHFFDGLNYG